jgi:hypothetical protein
MSETTLSPLSREFIEARVYWNTIHTDVKGEPYWVSLVYLPVAGNTGNPFPLGQVKAAYGFRGTRYEASLSWQLRQIADAPGPREFTTFDAGKRWIEQFVKDRLEQVHCMALAAVIL